MLLHMDNQADIGLPLIEAVAMQHVYKSSVEERHHQTESGQ